MRSFHSFFTGICLSATVYAQSQSEYDYIVCGGGTAGLAIANRLSNDSSNSVLIVEAGINGTTNSWEYQSLPQKYVGGRVLSLPAGKTVGGSSQINGKVYSRPESGSIDSWGEVNNASGTWSWATLLPFYKASESLSIPSQGQQDAGNTYNDEYHGTSGPLNVSFPATPIPEYWTVLEDTAANLSIDVNRDFNGGKARGLSTYPAAFTIEGEREQRRESSREAYYLPVTGRSNLELLDETSCLRIIWADGEQNGLITARGVEIANTAEQKTITARKEVILSAGVYRSPTILEYSGVGNAKLLANYSIESRIDLPGVGENLQDQAQGNIFFQLSNTTNLTFPNPVGDEITTNFLMHLNYEDVLGDSAGDVQDSVNASLSEYATTISERINGTLTSDQILNSLQVQYDAIFGSAVPVVEVFSGQTLNNTHINLEFWPLINFGRGSVHISGGNPQAAGSTPFVDTNWFVVDADWEIFVAAGRWVRRFFATEPMASQVSVETRPGLGSISEDASDAEWRDYWKGNFRAGWHGVGSAAMIPREWGGVVDAELKVYGTANVRVVDASVIPFQLGGHPTSTVYALAERAADLILRGGSA